MEMGRWGVLDCLLISGALRVSLLRWLLARAFRSWWIASGVVASRSAIEELFYECHLAIHQAARPCTEYGIAAYSENG
jgi:hypothetical protein